MISSDEYNNLALGAIEWRHENWQGNFYPDDLPEDWQLSYYSNEFQCVMLPESGWVPGSGYDCSDWLDEINESFRFYLCLPESVSDTDEQGLFIQAVHNLDGHVAGIVLPPGVAEQDWLVQAGVNISQLLAVTKTDSYRCYQCSDQQHAIVLLDHSLQDMRSARQCLETALQGCAIGEVKACLVDGSNVDSASLVQFRQVIELMGL